MEKAMEGDVHLKAKTRIASAKEHMSHADEQFGSAVARRSYTMTSESCAGSVGYICFACTDSF
jgi:hypothetical protein